MYIYIYIHIKHYPHPWWPFHIGSCRRLRRGLAPKALAPTATKKLRGLQHRCSGSLGEVPTYQQTIVNMGNISILGVQYIYIYIYTFLQ